MAIKFEGQDRRQAKLNKILPEYGFKSLEDAKALCDSKGVNVDEIVKGIQPIAFEMLFGLIHWVQLLQFKKALKTQLKLQA